MATPSSAVNTYYNAETKRGHEQRHRCGSRCTAPPTVNIADKNVDRKNEGSVTADGPKQADNIDNTLRTVRPMRYFNEIVRVSA
ncbi:hypothetical protein QR680_013529 [Steinernema hermaphroditum]|uniref:Uncharacterized protein n=1 Tax=Steinernema hermaphroditum TaxID=289476 RepID=A0AA39I5T7_9BILA|nr:hypothetical protein QR680_013529 [Steinernema hermaphroditum]